MPTRTRHTTIVFRHPFSLKGHEGPWPAGACTVEPREEPRQGRSFLAYRRVPGTIAREPGRTPAVVQAPPVDRRDLAAAQSADRS